MDKNFVAALHSFAANPLLETAIPLLEVSPGLLTYFQECSPGGRFYYSHVAADVREAHSKKIRVHTIGRPPEFNDPHELDEWIMNHGGNTYHIEEWDIGVHVSEENVAKWKDPRTGDLYLVNRIVDGKWKCAFCKYDVFVKLQAAMGGK